MVTDSGTYKQADNKDRNKVYWATHDPDTHRFNFCLTHIFLFFCHRTSGTFGFLDTQPNAKNQKSHFFPTRFLTNKSIRNN